MEGKSNSEIEFLEILRLFFSYKYSISFITLLGALVGLGIALFSTPIYRADSLIQLEEKSSGGMALSADLSGLFADTPQSVAEIEILRSRMILGAVIKELKLDISASPKRLPVIGNFLSRVALPRPDIAYISSYAWNGERIEIAFLQTPENLLGEPLVLRFLGEDMFEITIGTQVLRGSTGIPLRRPELGFALLVDRISGVAGQEFILRQDSFADTLDRLRKNYSIAEQGKNSSILQLAVLDADPGRAADILEKIGEVYLLQNVSRNAAEAENSLNFISKQLPEAEANMRAAESAVNAYKLLQDSVDLSFETRALLEQAVKIEGQLNELLLQEQELQKRYTPAHPIYQTLLDNRAQLTAQLEDIRGQSINLPQTQLEMLRLTQDLEVTRQIYVQLVNRAQELSVIKAGTIGNIRIIDTPMTFPKPVKPAKVFLIAVATMLGFGMALGLALLRSMINRGVESPAEVEALGLSVYATIQKVGNGEYGGADKRAGPRPILAKTEPANLSVEALRSLRTSLHFGMLDSSSKTLLMTSSRPGEGKSFISANLATVMAQSGQNICLVDADIRRGYLRRYFGVEESAPGLTDILTGDASLDDVLYKDPETGLSFIPAGKYPPNPSELFMHRNFDRFCTDLDARFDLSILDAPPLLAVTDPIIIGKYAGMTMLVVRQLVTHINEVEASLRLLENNGLKANAAVLNGYSPKANRGNAGAYSYQYAYKSRV